MRFILVVSLFLLNPELVFAEKSGNIGPRSQATSTVSVTIPPRLDVASVEAVDALSTGTTARRSIKVASPIPAGLFALTVSGSGKGGALELVNKSKGSIPFQVFWDSKDERTTVTRLRADSQYSVSSGSFALSSLDSSTANTSGHLELQFARALNKAVQQGNYTGTLLLTVEPQ